MKKIAIFGGTFNPVHWGHLLMAETAFDQAQLDQVLWVPTYQPPHKLSQAAPISYHHRLAMVKLAIASHPGFAVSTIERDRAGISYAIDTLNALQASSSNAQWFWIIGLDAFRTLPQWQGHPHLAQSCRWLVAPRFALNQQTHRTAASSASSDTSLAGFEAICQQVVHQLAQTSIDLNWQLLSMPIVNLSSSLVRTYCSQGRSIRYLVPDPVRAYLLKHQLYRGPDRVPPED